MLEHADDQVLEFLREIVCTVRLVLRVSTPESGRFTLGDSSVERVLICLSRVERRSLGDHDEKNDAESEQVDGLASVGLSVVDLRCHIVLGAESGRQESRAVSTFQRTSKAEVRDLKIIVLIKKKILGLHISVSDTVRVAIVETFESLLEVVTGHWLGERSGIGDEVKDLTMGCNAKHDKVYLFAAAFRLKVSVT